MSFTTAANIVTNVMPNVDSSLILANDIAAAEWLYIRGGLILTYPTSGADMYDTIAAAPASYATLVGYFAKALEYFTAFTIFERLGSKIETRGIFDLNAETASKTGGDTKGQVKAELLRQGNTYFSQAIYYINENLADTYSDVPTGRDWDWNMTATYDTGTAKRQNNI